MPTRRFSEPPPDPPAELRRFFLLDPEVAFLNHGSFGACPLPVLEAYWDWHRRIEVEPVRFFRDQFEDSMAHARARLAAYVGCPRDDLVFVPNATTAVNTVARSLPLSAGDEILTTNHEYGACDRAWQFICRRTGASYRPAELPEPAGPPAELVDAIWSQVTERTKVLFLSHITSPSALLLPVAELCALARQAGILTFVDGAHGPGQVPLHLAALGCDFYTGNCHKWLCAPKGSAFLYSRPEVQHLVEPLVVSWGGTYREPGPSRYVDELEYGGTRDYAACLAVPAALDFLAAHDWASVSRTCVRLLRAGIERLLELPGVRPVLDGPTRIELQMAAVRVPFPSGRMLARRLADGYAVEVGAQNWQGESLLRLSVQGYNGWQDVERAVSAVSAIAAGGWA